MTNHQGNSVGIASMLVLSIILMCLVMCSSCGTWKWVEPMPPNAANNHRLIINQD